MSAGTTATTPKRRRRWRRWILGIGTGLVMLLIAGGFAVRSLAHAGPIPTPLMLPDAPAAAGPDAARPSDVSGTWSVAPPSVVGFRVDQVVLGERSTIVSRTNHVTGSITITGSDVTAASFTADLTDAAANDSQRKALDVDAHPTAGFRLSRPIPLDPLPAVGAVQDYGATGELSFRGVTRPVSFTVRARRDASAFDVLAVIPVAYGDWGLQVDQLGQIASLESPATLEVLLHLTTQR